MFSVKFSSLPLGFPCATLISRSENIEAMDQLLGHITAKVPELETQCQAVIADFAMAIANSCKRFLPNSRRLCCGLHYGRSHRSFG